MVSYFVQLVVSCSYQYLLSFEMWPVGTPSNLFLYSFDIASSFFELFRTFWHKIFQDHLVVFLVHP